MNYCPCCSGLLLQHIRSSGVYWFCRNCWEEMPVFIGKIPDSLSKDMPDRMMGEFTQKAERNIFLSLTQGKSITGWIGV